MCTEKYNIWRKDRLTKQEGIIIITRSELQARHVHIYMPDEDELIAAEIKTEEGDVTIGKIYMFPPARTCEKR